MLMAFLAIPTVSPALGSMLLPHYPHKTLMDFGMEKRGQKPLGCLCLCSATESWRWQQKSGSQRGGRVIYEQCPPPGAVLVIPSGLKADLNVTRCHSTCGHVSPWLPHYK